MLLKAYYTKGADFGIEAGKVKGSGTLGSAGEEKFESFGKNFHFECQHYKEIFDNKRRAQVLSKFWK